MVNDSQYKNLALLYAKRCIETKAGLGTSRAWTHSDYLMLADSIQKQTRRKIGISTLKRTWNRQSGVPSPKTLNILANFLGYVSWFEFLQKNQNEIHQFLIDEKPLIKKKSIFIHWRKILLFAAIAVTMPILYFFILSKIPVTRVTSFEPEKTDGVLPFAAIIKYDISKVRKGDVFIVYNDIKQKKKALDKKKNIYKILFFTPGRKNVSFIYHNKKLKTLEFNVTTKDWVGIIKNLEITHPLIFQKDSICRDGFLQINNTIFTNLDIIKSQVSYTYSKELPVQGDNMLFEIRLRYILLNGWDICQNINVTINFSNGFINLPLQYAGCEKSGNLTFSEKTLSGNNFNLSSFSNDFTTPKQLMVKTINKQLTIYLNNNEIFKDSYSTSLGRMMMIKISFTGTGALDYVRVMNEHRQTVLEDDFNCDRVTTP